MQTFNPDGEFVLAFGRTGSGVGEFKEPNGVAVDAAGNIYVVDASNHKLMRFGPDGNFAKEWKGPDSDFTGRAILPSDRTSSFTLSIRDERA